MAKKNGAATATATEATEGKRRRGLSPESQLKLALNDVLETVKDGTATTDSPEVVHATALLGRLGFETRKSSAKRMVELQEELRALDITDPASQTRMNEISKELGRLRKV